MRSEIPKSQDMPRNDQVTRILKVLQILEAYPRGLTVKDLHQKLSEYTEVTERTVRRDLDAILEAGFAFEQEDAPGPDAAASPKSGRQTYKLQTQLKAGKNLVLNPRELLALYLAKGALEPLKDTAFYEDLSAVFRKIDDLIEPRGRQVLDEIASHVQFEPSPRWALDVNPDVLETLRAACAEGHVLSVVYDSGRQGMPKPRRLGPQFLYFAKASLYLVAEDLESRTVKVYSVPRMSGAVMCEESYSGTRVDPERFFASTFGVYRSNENPVEVIVRVDPPMAAFARERRWHESQRVVVLEGGAVEIRLHVAITPELVNWVLGFGEFGEVVGPGELKSHIRTSVQALCERYAIADVKRAS